MNFVSDLDFVLVDYEGMTDSFVHLGFYYTYHMVSSSLIKAVAALQTTYPTASILVTGHSLGAALATHAAVDIKRKLNPSTNMTFYSYGSPRVGNAVFADYVMTLFPNGTYQRVSHYTDGAVHMPLSEMGFKHAGDEVWYFNEGETLGYKLCQNGVGEPENDECANSNYSLFDRDSHWIYLGHKIAGMCTSHQR